jgi:predicted Zn-dependent protease
MTAMMKSMKHFAVLFFAISALGQNFAYAEEVCALRDKRICQYDAQLRAFSKGPGVTYRQDSTAAPAVAAEHEWVIGAPDIIHLGDTLSFNDDELLFLLAHEYGHAVKKHGRLLLESVASPEDRTLSDIALLEKYKDKAVIAAEYGRELNHQQEYEADAFGAAFMQHQQLDALAAMRGVLKAHSSSATHPSRRARLDRAKQFLTANL